MTTLAARNVLAALIREAILAAHNAEPIPAWHEWLATYLLAAGVLPPDKVERAKRLQSAHHRLLKVTAATCDACRAERARHE